VQTDQKLSGVNNLKQIQYKLFLSEKK